MRSQKPTRRNLVDSEELLRVYFLLLASCAPMMNRLEKKEILFAIQSRLKSFVTTVSFRCLIVSRICESERDARRETRPVDHISRCKCVCVKFNCRNTGDVSQSKLPISFIHISPFFFLLSIMESSIQSHRFPLITLYHALLTHVFSIASLYLCYMACDVLCVFDLSSVRSV